MRWSHHLERIGSSFAASHIDPFLHGERISTDSPSARRYPAAMGSVLLTIIAVASMAAVGFGVWKLVNHQEAGDRDLQRKLDADDERARLARERRIAAHRDDAPAADAAEKAPSDTRD